MRTCIENNRKGTEKVNIVLMTCVFVGHIDFPIDQLQKLYFTTVVLIQEHCRAYQTCSNITKY